jgi:phosphoglycolate phosphatase-like HAD superfamily hydrolase
VESAVQAGCQVAAIKTGYGEEQKLRAAGAKWVIGEMAGIIPILGGEHA